MKMVQWANYPNAPQKVPYNSGIRPGGRSKQVADRKRSNNIANHQQRAIINRQRANSPNNPTWHGIGKHANVKLGH